jgi:hypothetical protein
MESLALGCQVLGYLGRVEGTLRVAAGHYGADQLHR